MSKIVPAVLFAVLASFIAGAPAVGKDDAPPLDLFKRFIAALNSKDGQKIKLFVEQDCSTDQPAAARAERLTKLAQARAPFQIVDVKPAANGELRALVADKGGERQTFTMRFAAGAQPKLVAVLLQDESAFDAKPPKDYAGWKSLDTLISSIREDTGSPGMGVAVIREGKAEVVATGIRELGKPGFAQADDPWSIGSIGKPLCTTVVGKLIEQGKLSWDTTIRQALPNVKMLPEYEAVTLELLMHHRSGLPPDGGFRAPEVRRIVGEAKTPSEIRANYVADILGRAPIAKPGERFEYSNAGFAVLGHIAETVTGKGYEELVKEFIFRPLGLKHSYTGVDALPDARPSGHMPGPRGLQPVDMKGPMEFMMAPAGGGMYMSVGDLAKFAQAHLEGLRGHDGLLKANTVARLHQGIPEGGPSPWTYACGWGIHPSPGLETSHGHNGSNGTMRAEMAIFPKSGLVVVAIVNKGGEDDPSPGLQAVQAIAKRYARQ